MPNWIDVMVAQERYNDMVRENDHDRRVAQMGQHGRASSLWRWLVSLLAGSWRPVPSHRPGLQVLEANGSPLPISHICEPPAEGTGHYLN